MTSTPEVDQAIRTITPSYAEALRAGRGEEAERVALAHLRAGMTVAELYEQVLAPAMTEIGAMWAAGEITIADEHLASALNLKVMSTVYTTALPSRPKRTLGRVVLAGVEGDGHEVGIRMAGDVIDLAGFDLDYLGADVPVEVLLDAVSRFRPQAVVVGVPSEAAVPAAAPTVAALHRCFPSIPVLVGGRGADPTSDGLEAGPLGFLTEQLLRNASSVADPEPRRRSKPRTPRWTVTEAPAPSAEDRMLEVAADAAEAARAHARAGQEFKRLAFEDPLTGVANRRALEDCIGERVESRESAVLVLIDLDGFKEVNDRGGHLVGDQVLCRVAALLGSVVTERDFVARMGGDEFAVLIDGADVDSGRLLARRFGRLLREATDVEGVTATCGISRLSGDRRAALIEADRALYRGKSLGGDMVA